MFPKPDNKQQNCIIHGDLKTTYEELIHLILCYKNILLDLKHQNIERIGIVSENRKEWIAALYAGLEIGAVVVPIDFTSSEEDLCYILTNCGPQVLFCSSEKKALVYSSSDQAKSTADILVFEEINQKNFLTSYDEFSFSTNETDNTAVIIYTSGTTGGPKGVMIGHRAIASNIQAVSNKIKIYAKNTRTFAFLPFHHIFPLIGCIMAPLQTGGTIILTPSLSSPDMLKTMQEHKVHILIGVPRFYQLIATGIKNKIESSLLTKFMYSFAKLISSRSVSKFIFKAVHNKLGGEIKHIVCGGAALDQDIAKIYYTLGFDLLEGYGMTEAAPMISFTRPNEGIPGSGGKIFPGFKVKIVENEVWAKGPNIMKGYYNNPEATNQAVTSDGWLKTGDLGYLDDKGRLFITGRKKDLIVLSNGKNISPEEIEFKIQGLSPLIKEVGVYPLENQIRA